MIEAYLPNPPDDTLDMSEYYYRRETTRGPQVIRVFVRDVLPHEDVIEYGLYQRRGSRLCWIDTRGDGDRLRGARMAELYDNYQDCKDQTHYLYDNWELLRSRQRGEA